MKTIAALLLLSFLTAGSLFAGLTKYREWGNSPQSYFLTQAERARWESIRTDEEAGVFIDAFLASRGKGFADRVAQRAGMADKYLTVGKTAGSKTLRGKVVILFGPPSKMDMTTRRDAGKLDNPVVSGAFSNVSPSGGGGSRDEGSSAVNKGIPGAATNVYTMTYGGDILPSLHKSEFSVVVDVDAASGKDRLHDRKAAEALFEEAARASIEKR